MLTNLILFIEVFVFTFCCLNIIKNIYSFIKVLNLKDGKMNNNTLSTVLFGLSISFVITCLILGF